MTATYLLPFFSLAVALAAVVVGPTITLRIAKRQMATNLEVARIQAAAPVAQARIKELTDALADFCAIAYRQLARGSQDLAEAHRWLLLVHKIDLMLDASDPKQNELLGKMGSLVSTSDVGPHRGVDFSDDVKKILALGNVVLRAEQARLRGT